MRRAGVQMLFADAGLSSLVVTGVSALAAFPAGTLPKCTTEDALVSAVYGTLAARITASQSGAVALGGASFFSGLVSSAATDRCGATAAVLSDNMIKAILTQGSLLYQTAQTELAATAELTAELTALPLEALSVASRVLYVVQTKAATALADLDINAAAVQELLAGWSSLLEYAPVNLATMAAALGMASAPEARNVKLSARAAGALTQCTMAINDMYQMSTTSAVTDNKGSALLLNVMGPLVTVPPGCRDAVLSTSSRTVTNKYALVALTPLAADNVTVDAVAMLTTAVFLAIANTAPSVEARHISAADYAAVYHFFGVGRPDAPDALPDGADFVRQNWVAKATVGARTYLLNLKLQAVLGPLSGFVSGLLGSGASVDGVAQDFVSMLASDLLAGTLSMTESSYLNDLMGSYYRRKTGVAQFARRRLHALTSDQMSQLLSSVASTVSGSSALLNRLDQQVVAAAAAGKPLDPALVFLSAAQIASVQQTSMSAALTQLAAAAASGDLAAVDALTAAFENSFTGAALQSAVQSAVVDSSALAGMMSGSGGTTPMPESGNGGGGGDGGGTGTGTGGGSGGSGGSGSGEEKKKSNAAVIVGASVGAIGGVALAAAVVLITLKIKKTRSQQHVSPRTSRRFDAQDAETGGPGGAGVAAMGAATLPPVPSAVTMPIVAAAPPPPPAAPLPPMGPAPLPHSVISAPEPDVTEAAAAAAAAAPASPSDPSSQAEPPAPASVGLAPASWPSLTPVAAPATSPNA